MRYSQRRIYDERYAAGRYDRRSAVRVLTAEREALTGALHRTLAAHPGTGRVTLFDFGYGTGRVTNELAVSCLRDRAACRDLQIVAYDVSSAGLQAACAALHEQGFTPGGALQWAPGDTGGYIAGSVSRTQAGRSVSVVFVHGDESESPGRMRQLALEASGGHRYLITTSWYGGLGHVPGESLRRAYFRQLSAITSPAGEIVIAVSATGDRPEEVRREWPERGDFIYATELGQDNFYHVFGTDLNDHMAAITSAGQHWQVRGIRWPGREFGSAAEELANCRQVRAANQLMRGRAWTAQDYRQFHTVAALRSGIQQPAEYSSQR